MPKCEPLEKRFFSKVIKTDNCWLWTGANGGTNKYGIFWFNNKRQKAHRVSFQMFIGTIPENMGVLHACDNPPCVNPDHLFLGTHLENMRDKVNKNRQSHGNFNKTHCKYGHELTLENRSIKITSKKYKTIRCKTCHKLRERMRNRRKKLFTKFF